MTDIIEEAEREFTEYFVRNYPGPDTVIYDPKWHAPKLFRAATHKLSAALSVPIDPKAEVGSTHEERVALAEALTWDINNISPDDVREILTRLAGLGFELRRSASPSIVAPVGVVDLLSAARKAQERMLVEGFIIKELDDAITAFDGGRDA